jgi:hypothetical protein
LRLLLAAGLAQGLVLAAGRAELARGDLVVFFAVYAAQTAAYLTGLRAIAAGGRDARWPEAAVVVGIALALRVALLPLPVFLTTDLARYRHDGGVLASGGNPYAQPPGAGSGVPHGAVGTVYPPLAQALFALAAPHGELGFKLVAMAGDLAVAGLLALALARRARPVAGCLVWAWHPLVLWAFAGSGHVDSIGIALVLAALALADRTRPRAASAMLGLAAATKLAPLALALAWRPRLGGAVWIAPALLAAAYLPFASAGAGIASGLLTYARDWEHLGLAYVPLAGVLGPGAARLACLAALAALAVSAARWGAGCERTTQALIGAALCLTPTLHPWYVCWAIPLCGPLSDRISLILSLSAVGGYGALLGRPELGGWGRPGLWWFVVWVPFLVAAAGGAAAAVAGHRWRERQGT